MIGTHASQTHDLHSSAETIDGWREAYFERQTNHWAGVGNEQLESALGDAFSHLGVWSTHFSVIFQAEGFFNPCVLLIK
jgi:hypothetical protein